MGSAISSLLDKAGLRNRHETVVSVTGIQVCVYDVLSNAYGEHTTLDDVVSRSRLLVHMEDAHRPIAVSERHGALFEPRKVTKAVGEGLGCNLSASSTGRWIVEPDGGSVMWRPRDTPAGLQFPLPPRRGDENKRSVILHFDVMHPRLGQPQARARVKCALPQVQHQGSKEVVTVETEDEGVGDDIKARIWYSVRRQPHSLRNC